MWNDISYYYVDSVFRQEEDVDRIALQLDISGLTGNGEQESFNGNDHDLGCTWLGRVVSVVGRQLLD